MAEAVKELEEAGTSQESYWWLNALATVRLATRALTVVEVLDPPNEPSPVHTHHREDETFVVLEGSITVEIGGTTTVAQAGDIVHGPRGVPHRYTAGPEGSRTLYLMAPGGFEEFIKVTGVPADASTLPPASIEPDWDGVRANLQRFDLEINE